jgi:hypothetical protein
MFDLEAALGEWRRQMAAAGGLDPTLLAELEDHLREEYAALIRAGQADEAAWRAATEKFGEPRTIARELAQVHRLSGTDRAVLGLMVAGAATVIPGLGWALTRADFHAADGPLLATHIMAITLGYVAGLLAAGAAAYAIVRTLVRPGSTDALQRAALQVVRASSIVASALSLVGFLLGAAWAQGAWGRAFSGMPKEIGGLSVVVVFAVLAHLAWRRQASTRAPLAIAATGGGVILAAWFGAASMADDGAALFQALAFGGLAVSLVLAALALTMNDPRRPA